MSKCAKCKIKYPDEILSPVLGGGISGGVCGICALEIMNEVLGVNRTEFDGETAEYFRQEALRIRKGKNSVK